MRSSGHAHRQRAKGDGARWRRSENAGSGDGRGGYRVPARTPTAADANPHPRGERAQSTPLQVVAAAATVARDGGSDD